MKVLVLSHMYPSTANEVAGIFVHEQVKTLMAKGIKVRVVSPVPWAPFPLSRLSRKWRAYSRIPQGCVWDEVKVSYPRYLAFPRAWFFPTSGHRMYRGIRRTIESIYRQFPFDLIHAHVALPDGYAGALLAQDFGKSLVITVHGQDLQQTVHRSPGCRVSLAFAMKAASRVIVVSRKLYGLACKYFDVKDKVVVISNGIDPRKVIHTEAEVTEGKKESPNVLSVSNLVLSKGIDLNTRAIAFLQEQYPNLRYEVVGSGPEEKRLRGLARRLGIESRVKFLGRRPHDQVLEHMAACTVFSLPSWNEGFGIVYLEAMALGKPVIGCQGEGIEDFVDHGKTGLLVRRRDINGLVEALGFLLSHPEEAKAMGERARRLVLENYTWERNAEKTIEVYREVLNER